MSKIKKGQKMIKSRMVAAVAAATIGYAAGASAALLLEEDPAATRGCVVRLYSTGPEIHANGSHACTAVEAVSVSPRGDLRLQLIDTGTAVEAFLVGVDETLATRGVSCGPSGGVGPSAVACGIGGHHVSILDPRVTCTRCNLWILLKQR